MESSGGESEDLSVLTDAAVRDRDASLSRSLPAIVEAPSVEDGYDILERAEEGTVVASNTAARSPTSPTERNNTNQPTQNPSGSGGRQQPLQTPRQNEGPAENPRSTHQQQQPQRQQPAPNPNNEPLWKAK
eukprot:CAMPEP_0201669192 /NCGR_PEP_ID=MMETSP0494-20130426/22620_1 /ASSEMBLY_ACC=CAM_ASM_000839 /TAXON_ID=420259 /ORGANISM="Thalassiosira gravida, Strain GMp14c1" /LENGTH=130 /DNA_ID=CAMNT_0048149863 /DNA_START=1 /DNA_END=390 /DNA_ORIENTATION=-